VTEAEARAALAAFDSIGGLERWIAAQRPWKAVPGGWTVPGDLQGWRFRVEVVLNRLIHDGEQNKGMLATLS
jgi:hypothetical protein